MTKTITKKASTKVLTDAEHIAAAEAAQLAAARDRQEAAPKAAQRIEELEAELETAGAKTEELTARLRDGDLTVDAMAMALATAEVQRAQALLAGARAAASKLEKDDANLIGSAVAEAVAELMSGLVPELVPVLASSVKHYPTGHAVVIRQEMRSIDLGEGRLGGRVEIAYRRHTYYAKLNLPGILAKAEQAGFQMEQIGAVQTAQLDGNDVLDTVRLRIQRIHASRPVIAGDPDELTASVALGSFGDFLRPFGKGLRVGRVSVQSVTSRATGEDRATIIKGSVALHGAGPATFERGRQTALAEGRLFGGAGVLTDLRVDAATPGDNIVIRHGDGSYGTGETMTWHLTMETASTARQEPFAPLVQGPLGTRTPRP
ncbi:hypothetical protein ASD62_05745 [Phycicoccus sp. Root563]|uniref:hypothetical protein n=1 Tax=Phycicoccus sp. Root563 TaxID=1736562 RepID=UPI000702C1EA|nr:hypothetical protein [Phycicoccus sp. Root563]KQZ88879.1 hypothetical protein ASD62_05745 [Phycicoccus sp. Root563]